MILGRYLWNIALCQALYPALHSLEVAFRNRLHEALKLHFGVPSWFDMPWLLDREQDKVAAAKQELRKRNAPLEADRVVAELSFGDVIRQTLPHMPKHLRKRTEINKRMHTLRLLRNRVFHYEPIWHWEDLPRQHADLRQALEWFEPELLKLLCVPPLFEEVHSRGPAAYELDVR
ncbi:hypothetical protein SAMN05443639_116118 [Stigmatella erecta]|uniref:Abi-like protein n=1 Tax=Stigmatella erecta TaxID=83460 RepID=A0A1I0KZQ9_9BACT|nr:hypothetical protein SAMN05443639_116118 [Stigmatella erecta]